ncbi:MAG: tetratricopeptide repeat protein [Acidobacteria bacterium]|nr:tetratricopeptide repeat protein [Acidobacteriota bacterium]
MIISLLLALIVAPIAGVVAEKRQTARLKSVEKRAPVGRSVPASDERLRVAQEVASPASPAVDAAALVARVAADAMRWGTAALAEGDLAQAEAQFDAVIAMRPQSPDAWNGLGKIHMRQGRVGDAIAEFDEAIRLDAAQWTFRFNRGRARALQKQWQAAVDDYRAAAAHPSHDALTHYHMGLALMELGRFELACRALERAVALAPERPGFLVTLGSAYLEANLPDGARHAFERFLERAPDDVEAAGVRTSLGELNHKR